jgi:hypothetical protein
MECLTTGFKVTLALSNSFNACFAVTHAPDFVVHYSNHNATLFKAETLK